MVDTELPYLRLVPARFSLLEVEKALSLRTDRKLRLRDQIRKIADEYEYVLLDAPPSLNFLAVSAMVCADWLMIPVQCQIFTLEGMSQLLQLAATLQKEHNPALGIAGVLFTMCPSGAEGKDVCAEEMLASFRDNLFRTTIPWDELLRESSDFGRPLVLHDITALGARAYLKLAMELVQFFESQPMRGSHSQPRTGVETGGMP